MKEILTRICSLQTQYSSSNTSEMKERGYLIRTELAQKIQGLLPILDKAFDDVFDDIAVEGSDGIGRKTEAPWVRLFSRAMSPNPREGFYLVIHFAANGSAVFFTVGCGSTIWSGGDLRPISDEELAKRTSWARSVIIQRWGSTSPFDDVISLGARAPLPRTFEKATAFAKKVKIDELIDSNIESILFDASARLNHIYLAQLTQRDISQGDQDANTISEIAQPLKIRSYGRQGVGLTSAERKAVELRAMEMAVDHLKNHGFACKDTSATEPFDLLAVRDSVPIKVEVKGTTSDLCDSVLMTKNEVELHRNEKGQTGLIIVSRIRLSRENDIPTADGGTIEALLGWDIDQWIAEPIAFKISR